MPTRPCCGDILQVIILQGPKTSLPVIWKEVISKLRWWIGPMGAVFLSLLVSGLWLHSAYDEFQLLVGVTADTKDAAANHLYLYVNNTLLYNRELLRTPSLAMTHSPLITAIDTVHAYTSGPRLLLEVDVVMEASESLRATHHVADALQTKLESLPDVERAYVHVDYEMTHKPKHFLKKEL